MKRRTVQHFPTRKCSLRRSTSAPAYTHAAPCNNSTMLVPKNRATCLPIMIGQFSLGPRRFHLRMGVRVAFCLWQSACNPSASLVQPPPAFPFRVLRETDPCLQTILEIYFQIPDLLSTYAIPPGTSQAHLFELERIGKWVLLARTRPCMLS